MRKKLLFFIFLITSFFNYAQVGINTSSPDPSSVLDIVSTTSGMLTPRMTTVQRNAIATPAEGLLVFDTDEDAFYYYDLTTTTWIKLEGAIVRDNYKLVKDITDLSDELAAGGGSQYELNSDYLYEINGTITFDYPINLNGAHIEGRDTGEDIIENASGSTFFSGSTGGHLKNIRIEGGNQQLFNISGSGVEGLVAYSVIVNNVSSMGSLDNLYVVFFEVLQVLNSNNGLNVSNITSFFMDKIFWTDSNSGTFLTLSGNLGNTQIANGRVVADTGETGIDVSANPTIGVSASISQVSFTGDGTLVNPYTTGTYAGYNFTNAWDIDSPGIKLETDNNAFGDIILNYPIGSGATTTFTGTGAASRTKILGNTISNNLFRFTSTANNRITYDGTKTRFFGIKASLSFQGDNNNAIFIFYFAKNGTVIEDSRVYREVGANNDVGAVAIIDTIELAPGDYIEVWVERYTGGGNLLTASLNLIAR